MVQKSEVSNFFPKWPPAAILDIATRPKTIGVEILPQPMPIPNMKRIGSYLWSVECTQESVCGRGGRGGGRGRVTVADPMYPRLSSGGYNKGHIFVAETTLRDSRSVNVKAIFRKRKTPVKRCDVYDDFI